MGRISAPVSSAELSRWLEERSGEWEELLAALVDRESPSGDPDGIRACGEVVVERMGKIADAREVRWGGSGSAPCLGIGGGGGRGRQVLLLGHLDTVWERGAFGAGFRIEGGRATGPGVFDMKGGVVVAVAALAALADLGGEHPPVRLLLTGDEEVGSAGSLALIEEEARSSRAVLVLEPPAGGALKVARKGVGTYRLTMRGRAAHAGLEPELGVNAVTELARLVGGVELLADPRAGTSVTPTVFRGGGRSNVVPESAELRVDVRYPSSREMERVDLGLRSLRPENPGARLEVAGGPNRPPLEAAASAAMFGLAQSAAAWLGWPELRGAQVGGGSDGNFTAALGVPTLDGMGVVGGEAHAPGEWADLRSIPERAALLAGCLWGMSEPGG